MNPLLELSQGITDYIQRHNANYGNIYAAIVALENMLSSQLAGSQSPGTAYSALFGSSAARIGGTSYTTSSSSSTLTVSSGFAWRPSLGLVLTKSTSTAISFSGLPAATYYIVIDAQGNPVRTTDITEALYSVVWNGSSFGTVTAIAPVIWAASEWVTAQTSSALGQTYQSLDTRLEAGETKAVAGDSAQTWKKGLLSKSVAGGVDVTLTATEANNFAIDFTGTITNNINVNISLSGGPRGWVVRNNTSGNFTLTLKGSSGAGVKLPRGVRVWVMHDGSNIVAVKEGPNQPAIASVPYAASVTADYSYAEVVRVTLTGNATFVLSGAVDGQKCVLELTQGGAGGHSATFGAEVRYGTDLTVLTLSSTAGKTDRIGFIYDSASGKYDPVAIVRGF